MLRFIGARRQLCDGISRRDLRHIGGLGMYGLTLGHLDRLAASPSPTGLPRHGQAKSCMMLYLFGTAPQHETFDPKDDAPVEVQGEFRGIPSAVPGVSIGEGLPRTAGITNRLTIIRSMTHPFPLHGVAYARSGMPADTADAGSVFLNA